MQQRGHARHLVLEDGGSGLLHAELVGCGQQEGALAVAGIGAGIGKARGHGRGLREEIALVGRQPKGHATQPALCPVRQLRLLERQLRVSGGQQARAQGQRAHLRRQAAARCGREAQLIARIREQ